jgi:hypothetical protein
MREGASPYASIGQSVSWFNHWKVCFDRK